MATIQSIPAQGRVGRYPKHTFQVLHRPWQIQPIMVAPVLPGETLENLLLQAYARTDPIRNDYIGWWMEHYFFYVKWTDLVAPYGSFGPGEIADMMQQMAIDPSASLASLVSAGSARDYHGGADMINWLEIAQLNIVREFFRDPSERDDPLGPSNEWTLDGCYTASCLQGNNWMDTLVTGTAMPDGGDPSGATSMEQLAALEAAYNALMQSGLSPMTFQDYCAMYGVRVNRDADDIPEVIMDKHAWKRPSRAVDPTDGSIAAAVTWEVAERQDKRRLFKVPGWIMGFTVCRPKVYMKNVHTAAANVMDNQLSWLPAYMRDAAFASLKNFADNAGPVADAQSGADGYWIDVQDLFLYGDQFHNLGTTYTGRNFVTLPKLSTANRKYPLLQDAKDLFTQEASSFIQQDGVVSMSIKGAIVERT